MTLSEQLCPTCGRPIDLHNRDVRLVLPDPVLDVPVKERPDRTWGRDPLIQVQGVGAFVRVLLPIRLTQGFTLTVGTWLAIDPPLMRSVWEGWWTPAYESLQLDGTLANRIRPWGDAVFGAVVHAAVGDPTEFPYLRSSTDAMLADVLAKEWPHEDILDAYASVL